METVFQNMENARGNVPHEKVNQDLRALAREAEEFLKVGATDTSYQAKAIRSLLIEPLDKAKATCHRLEEKTVAAARATDKIIRVHPYGSIGIACGVGLLVGVLVARMQGSPSHAVPEC